MSTCFFFEIFKISWVNATVIPPSFPITLFIVIATIKDIFISVCFKLQFQL